MLSGIVVVDLTRALAGPHATMLLGDLGARVIKVESPAGDDSRGWGPFVDTPDGGQVSTYFLCCNRNKESVTLDLKSPAGHRFLTRLIRRADVLVENFRPGVMDRLGLGPDRLRVLNSRLIVCSISGFGHDGPEGRRAGYDQIAQGEGGLMSVTGPDPLNPTRVGVPIADVLAGMNAALGIVAALRDRDQTGRGHVVRTSLLAGIVGVHAFQGTAWTVAGQVPVAQGNHHPSIAPYGMFHTADAPVQISVGNETLWAAFAPLVGLRPDDPRFATNTRRIQQRPALIALIESSLVAHPADYWLARLEAIGVPAGKIRTLDDVYGWEQTRSQGLVIRVEHDALGALDLPGPALRFDENPHAGAQAVHRAPPSLGEHNDLVAEWLDAADAGYWTDASVN